MTITGTWYQYQVPYDAERQEDQALFSGLGQDVSPLLYYCFLDFTTIHIQYISSSSGSSFPSCIISVVTSITVAIILVRTPIQYNFKMPTTPEKSGSAPSPSEAVPSTMMPPPNRPATTAEATISTATTTGMTTDRHMNDSTMPPPRYGNGSNKSATNTSTAAATAAATPTANITPTKNTIRKKVPAVDPRHRFGLHDWKRLLAASGDLAQRKGQPIRRDMTVEEVASHCKNHDGWIILRGRVYNIGPYLPYHPGGVRIFKNLLGKDATAMFDKYHRWVNIEGLIGPLLLGFIINTPPMSQNSNPFSVVPPKEAQLTYAPRVAVQAASGSSLLLANDEDEDDNDDDDDEILPQN